MRRVEKSEWVAWPKARREYGLSEGALLAYVHTPGVRMQDPPPLPDGKQPRGRYINRADLERAIKRRTTTTPHYDSTLR